MLIYCVGSLSSVTLNMILSEEFFVRLATEVDYNFYPIFFFRSDDVADAQTYVNFGLSVGVNFQILSVCENRLRIYE